MKQIKTYKDKFYQLLESEIGDVKPIISEKNIQTLPLLGIANRGVEAAGKIYNKVKSWVGSEEKKENITCDLTPSRDWKNLYNNLITQKKIRTNEPLLIVWGPKQKCYYTKDGKTVLKEMTVSTGKNGFSNNDGNSETSIGLVKVTNKIQTPKMYQVIVGKKPINTILGPNTPSERVDEKGKKHTAEVLTGLLELSGLEDCNQNIFNRNVYFHGTNVESRLGTQASGGCVRVSNNDIVWLTQNISIGTKVYIYPDDV